MPFVRSVLPLLAVGCASTHVNDIGAATDNGEILATLNGKPISLTDVMGTAGSGLIEAQQALVQAKRDAVDIYITEQLVERDAEAQGLSTEELIKREIENQPPPTEEALRAFYDENAERIGEDFDTARPRIEMFLTQQGTADAFVAYTERLRQGASIDVMIEPFRVTIADGDAPRWGKATAPIQIVEFSDFQCPYCARGAETMDQVKAAYGEQVSIVYRHFPLSNHPQAFRAGEASECAAQQDAFWGYHDALFAKPMAWTDDDLVAIAQTLQLDDVAFQACLASDGPAERVRTDMEAGASVGMTGTPGFYINGIPLFGAQPFDAFKDVIDAELKRVR